MNNVNVLFLFSDEHRRDASGCYGHHIVQTPNLDRLASTGTRFSNAYTSSPICVPARASLATGQYVHKTRCWSNAQAYEGDPISWGHHLQKQGHRVDSIGKLHYRGKEYDNGFKNEILPLYIKNGKGWIKGLLRNHEGVLDCSSYAREIGPGDDSYTDYDLGVTQEACNWLQNGKNNAIEKPWTLFVSWLRPHYPLTCPQEFYDLYAKQIVDPGFLMSGLFCFANQLEVIARLPAQRSRDGTTFGRELAVDVPTPISVGTNDEVVLVPFDLLLAELPGNRAGKLSRKAQANE